MNVDFNQSRDDPWQRAWLTSRELFIAYHNIARHGGEPIHRLLGGVVYAYDSGRSCAVQVWVSPTEVIVAYHPVGSQYGFRDEREGFHEFDEWIHHLRRSEPLELGFVRNRSSYGAVFNPGVAAVPAVKWGQRGDWMFIPRDWPIVEEEWTTHSGDPDRMLLALPTPASERKRLMLNAALCRRVWHLLGTES